MPPPPSLQIHDLRLELPGAGRLLLDGITLTVATGTRTALVGASGSGKSLTVAALLGTLPHGARPTGRIRIEGTDVLGIPAARRPPASRPGAVHQDPAGALHPFLPVGRQLGLVTTSVRRRELLTAVGFDDPGAIARAVPAELSGGQRQRLCLALALTSPGRLLVADEPTTALDVVTQAGVVDLLRRHTGAGTDRSLLLVTHDLAVAAQLCDEIVVLDDGRVVESGSLDAVRSHPRSPRTRELLEAARTCEGHLPVPTGVAT